VSLQVKAVLFDLDGTLIDSAPDLAGTANDMRAARGLPALPFEQFRPMVGSGARGMIGVALGISPAESSFIALRDEFFDRYEVRMTQHTRPFDAVPAMLDAIETRGLRWGIVTNKAKRFTNPLVRALGLDVRAGAVVSGDTTPHSKPHPAPLLEAARQMGVAAQECVYVGDDLRDVQAGQAAGMATVAVGWGYLGVGEPVEAWGAEHVVQSADELLKLLGMA
jgi:2-phosphoglycolate phosphatase